MSIYPVNLTGVTYRHAGAKSAYTCLKRLMDVVISLAGILLLGIPMLLIALAVRLSDGGPALYTQERLGKGGVPFTIYKFRSMRLDAERLGAKWAEKDDPRITRVGLILRKFRLDELPQLFNILSGEMSLVGPRPERLCFYRIFEKEAPGFTARLLAKPGLTGYAQISGGYDLSPAEKLHFDMAYIRSRSLRKDITILLRTVPVVLRKEGAR